MFCIAVQCINFQQSVIVSQKIQKLESKKDAVSCIFIIKDAVSFFIIKERTF